MNQTDAAPPPPHRFDTSVAMQRPLIVGLLYLLAIVTGVTAIVGVILAYIWRGEPEAQPWEQTHYTYLIRTFWIGLGISILFMTLFIGGMVAGAIVGEMGGARMGRPPIGFFVTFFGAMVLWLLATVWFVVRCVLSMVKSGRREPMPSPRTWMF
ncbi:MAG: hypothetical protein WBA68_05120 [Alteraurantiacibacter sp.]